jgi:hypothetical protein
VAAPVAVDLEGDEEEASPDGDYEMHILRPIAERLAEASQPEDCWLWCLECSRFFQVKHTDPANRGDRIACPFPGCGAQFYGVDTFFWDDWADASKPRWPRSESEIWYGREAW